MRLWSCFSINLTHKSHSDLIRWGGVSWWLCAISKAGLEITVRFFYILSDYTVRMDYREFWMEYYSLYKSLLECFNQSSVVAGGCCGSTKKLTIVGGWAWAWWLVTDVQYLSLEVSVYIYLYIARKSHLLTPIAFLLEWTLFFSNFLSNCQNRTFPNRFHNGGHSRWWLFFLNYTSSIFWAQVSKPFVGFWY